jgi:dolichol-phosphate mannosyltransferase
MREPAMAARPGGEVKSAVPEGLTIIIPVYNEGANFPILWQALCSQVHSDFVAMVVYDFPEDNTVPILKQIVERGETRLRPLQNSVRRGVVGAILTGFQQVQRGPVLVVMADLSDDLGQVDKMLALYGRGYKLVAGSRYMKGGSLQGGPWFKQLLSRGAGLSLHWLRRIPIHDATNAFKIYDSEMLRSFTLESRGGFELNLEITVKAFLAGYPMAEIPTRWCDRTAGQSRFRLWAWLPRYLKWYVYAFRPRRKLAQAPVQEQGCGLPS